MKYEEAMDWCEQFTDNLIAANVDTNRQTLGLQAMQKCKEALKKQMLKKVKVKIHAEEQNRKYHHCPVCDRWFTSMANYCSDCGQALDWTK